MSLVKYLVSSSYRVLQSVTRIKTNKRGDYLLSHFWPLLKQMSFFEAAGAVAKIGSSLKSNHHNLL